MKKNIIVILSCIIFIMLLSNINVKAFEESNEEKEGKVILIDPGHGGIDGGAQSKNGTIEKEINLQIALKLKQSLEEKGYKVCMTREADEGLYEQGKTIAELKAFCQSVIDTTDTLLLPNDLNHLRRGGRLTPVAALLGGLLKIKPVLQINQSTKGKIDVLDKVRTMSKAMDKVIERLIAQGVGEGYCIYVAHVDDEAGAKVYRDKIAAKIPTAQIEIIPLVSVVGVHTGLGCQALQTFKML